MEQTYEQAINRLEQIVQEIESGEMNIDALAQNMKEAQQLIKFCKNKLTKVEDDIQSILQEPQQ